MTPIRIPTAICALATALILCAQAPLAAASGVSLVGIFPGKALLSIDGGPPRLVAIGQSLSGIKVISIEGDAAVVEQNGKRDRLVLGAQPLVASSGGEEGGSAQTITLVADTQGHFLTTGSINGAAVRFMVDTGATSVAMGPSAARSAGISYLSGQPSWVGTANGMAQAWRVRIERITINGVTLRDVEGLVLSQDMPIVLLGMSFLNRMSMSREGSTMVLKRRY